MTQNRCYSHISNVNNYAYTVSSKTRQLMSAPGRARAGHCYIRLGFVWLVQLGQGMSVLGKARAGDGLVRLYYECLFIYFWNDMTF